MTRLKELRLSHGYKSQKDLADVLFVNQTAVSQWERGVTMPSGPMLIKLSNMFGVSTDYLLGRTDQMGEAPPEVGNAISEDDLKVAYFRGADPTLTQEDMDALWEDAKNFRDFIVERRKKERNGG